MPLTYEIFDPNDMVNLIDVNLLWNIPLIELTKLLNSRKLIAYYKVEDKSSCFLKYNGVFVANEKKADGSQGIVASKIEYSEENKNSYRIIFCRDIFNAAFWSEIYCTKKNIAEIEILNPDYLNSYSLIDLINHIQNTPNCLNYLNTNSSRDLLFYMIGLEALKAWYQSENIQNLEYHELVIYETFKSSLEKVTDIVKDSKNPLFESYMILKDKYLKHMQEINYEFSSLEEESLFIDSLIDNDKLFRIINYRGRRLRAGIDTIKSQLQKTIDTQGEKIENDSVNKENIEVDLKPVKCKSLENVVEYLKEQRFSNEIIVKTIFENFIQNKSYIFDLIPLGAEGATQKARKVNDLLKKADKYNIIYLK